VRAATLLEAVAAVGLLPAGKNSRDR